MSWIRRETEKGTVQYICPNCRDYHEFQEDFGEHTFSENFIFCRRCGAKNGTGTPPTLTPPNEWVSVEKRLPEYNPGTGAKSYWVAKKDSAGNWQMKIAQYCDYGYAMTMDAETEVTWRDWDFTKIANVTHWMPLPAPPDRRPPEGEA